MILRFLLLAHLDVCSCVSVYAIYSTHLCVHMSRFMLHLCLAGRQVHFNTCSKLSLFLANTQCAVQANQYSLLKKIIFVSFLLSFGLFSNKKKKRNLC